MAEQPFLVGNKARELLRYTKRATRIVSDDISRSDRPEGYFKKAAALEDIRRNRSEVCNQPLVHRPLMWREEKEGL